MAERLRLFQEDLRHDPFWMLVGCILVNCTTWRAAKPVHAELMRNHTPESMAVLPPAKLYPIVKGLGFGAVRSRNLVGLAMAWVQKPPRTAADVLELPGCGKFARDSWAIFVDGAPADPTDKKLISYLKSR
jgi:endonuclease III